MVPVAVNVIPVPEQILVADAEMDIEGVINGLTVIFNPMDVTVFWVKQDGNVPPVFRITFTTSLFDGT